MGATSLRAQDVAQTRPSATLAFDLRAGVAPPDDGYFNYGDYDHSTLRLFRLSLSTELRPAPWMAVLLEGTSENMDAHVRAAYLRVTPLAGRALDLQVGRIPPVFGSYARNAYGDDGPLVGWPLVYQYLTTVRADAVPSSADDLLAVRGRGWYVPYPSGAYPPGAGLPLASASRWDTGASLRLGRDRVQTAIALTRGSLSDPRVSDNNPGKQVAARVAFGPRPAFTLGLSGARGSYLDRKVTDSLPAGLPRAYHQSVLGLDLEVAHGHLFVRAEALASWWSTPALGFPAIPEPLRTSGFYLEARYKVAPGWTAGVRVDRLAFDDLAGSRKTETWDADVTRIEAGLSWTPRRHLTLRGVYQYNWRDTGRFAREGFVAGQLGLWF